MAISTGYKPPTVSPAPDLQKIANRVVLPQNLTVTPTPLLSSGVDFKSLTDTHQQAYNEAYQYGMLNKDAVISALQPGGTLSSSFGFSNATDVAGLTPEQVMALTAGRGVNQSLTAAQNTLDAVTNAPQVRQMMAHNADQQFQTGVHLLGQQSQEGMQAMAANAGTAAHLATAEAGFENAKYLQDQNLNEQWAQTQAHIASQERISSKHMAMEQKKLDLESRKLKIMQQTNPVADTGTVQNPGMIMQYNSLLTQLGALDPKTREMDFSKVDANHRSLLWQVYMQREAAKGLPWNQVYTVPETAKKDIGYGQLILGRDGWHGVFVDKGVKSVTNAPVIPYRAAAQKTAGGMAVHSLYGDASTGNYGE